jgi:hypothetical protein
VITTPLSNFLIPASGMIAGIQQSTTLSATPTDVDFSSQLLNGIPFVPQAMWIDNTEGSAPFEVTSQQLGNMIIASVPIGQTASVNFPSVSDDVYGLTGLGNVNITWSNAPLIPNLPTTIEAILVPGRPAANVAVTNVPMVTQEPISAPQTSFVFGTLAAGATVLNLDVPAGAMVRKITYRYTDDATLAADGYVTLTVANNGLNLAEDTQYFATVAATSHRNCDTIDFEQLAPLTTNTTLSFTLSSALTTGKLSVQVHIG